MVMFFPGMVDEGDAATGVGLCTLWTPKRLYGGLSNLYAVAGNLYSLAGVDLMIRNVLAEPSLKVIVVTGVDNPEPSRHLGQALLDCAFSGDDLRGLQVDASAIEAFYDAVHLIDARYIRPRNIGDLRPILETAGRMNQSSRTAVILPPPTATITAFPAPRSTFNVRAKTVASAHVQVLDQIRRFGSLTDPDKQGVHRQELWQFTVTLDAGVSPTNIPHYTDAEIQRYGDDLWFGSEPDSMTYRYGHTMRFQYGDQVAKVIAVLRSKASSYRAVISLWSPSESLDRDDEPCLTTVQLRLRGGALDLFAYIRTNEMFMGWAKNVAGLRVFQERIARELGVRVGELTTTSGSAHIYSYDIPAVDAYLANTQRANEAPYDPYGNFSFIREGDEFVAFHLDNEGAAIQTIRAATKGALRDAVLPFVGTIPHAAYIGKTIAEL